MNGFILVVLFFGFGSSPIPFSPPGVIYQTKAECISAGQEVAAGFPDVKARFTCITERHWGTGK